MPEVAKIALSAASLTAEEVATCYRSGIAFTDLVIHVVVPGKTFGRLMLDVRSAHDRGASIVWQFDPVCQSVAVFPSWTHLRVFHADDELAMDELPLFRCRVSEFFRLLGIPFEEEA